MARALLWIALCLFNQVLLPCQMVEEQQVHDLHIASLLPMTGVWPGGTGMLASINLALDNINNRSDILAGYRLIIHYENSEFRVYEGVRGLYHLLNNPPTKIAVLAAANSELSEASGLISELWNLVCISYASVSPVLSDKATFPSFFRTSAPETAANPARMELIRLFGWRKVATLHQARAVFDATVEHLENMFKEANITLLTSEVFQYDPTPQIQNLKKHDARIIFSVENKDKAIKILCEAYKIGMYGPKYLWFFPGWFDDGWWRQVEPEVECTREELILSAEGYMTAADVTLNPILERGISGINSEEFMELYDKETNHTRPFATNLVPQAYDAVWALALALNTTESQLTSNDSSRSLKNFAYNDSEMTSLIHSNLKMTRFQGVKSPIIFDENLDPIIMVKIARLQGGVLQNVGLYRPEEGNGSLIHWNQKTPLVWHGGRPTPDSTTVILHNVHVSSSGYVAMCILAALGILLACLFLALNIIFRTTKLIKMSSPNINNIILIGCMVMYITVFLQELNSKQALTFCKLRTYTMVVGFSLAFGALFSKTWRIHVIFANKHLKRRVVKDSQLVIMVVALLLIDLAVLVVWEIIDPHYIETHNTTTQAIDDGAGDKLIQFQVDQCGSQHKIYFQGTLYVIQGLLLLFGAFLAWETRKVKIPALNDSQHIGMCLYNTVVLSVVGVIMSFVTSHQVEMHFLLVSIMLLLGTTATQCIIFIPKVLKLRESRVSSEVEEEYTTNPNIKPGLHTVSSSISAQTSNMTDHVRIAHLEQKLAQALAALEQKGGHVSVEDGAK